MGDPSAISNRQQFVVTCVVVITAVGLMLTCENPVREGTMFPEVAGLTIEDPPRTYSAETLYDYLDGAAESYLEYGFEELTSGSYEANGEILLVIDLYRHRDADHAFGIYSQERPDDASFVDVGTEGYQEPGVLNFCKGRYYVKILDFRPDDAGSDDLEQLAVSVADRLPNGGGDPAASATAGG